MKFDYRFYEGKFLPIIPVKLYGKQGEIQPLAYVDSGASYSLFHADVAEILGLSLEEGEPHEMVMGDGNALTVYVHRIPIAIAGKEFTAAIGFSKGIGIGFNIIGRKDIFDQFIICFNEKERRIELTSH